MNVALYGFGRWGRNVARVMREVGESVRVIDVNGEAVDRARRAGYLASHIGRGVPTSHLSADHNNAVAICAPPDTHGDLVRQALEAGKHVWIEKPVAENADATAFLVALAHERPDPRVLFVDHTFAFAPAVQRLVAEVPSDVQHVEIVRTHRCAPRPGTDIIGDLLPHDLSILLACGLRVRAVYAQQGPHVAMLTLRFTLGMSASVWLSWASYKQRRMVFYARSRTVVYDHLDPREPVRVYDVAQAEPDAWSDAEVRSPVVSAREPLACAVDAFLAACAGEAPDNADEAIEVQRVVDAARKAARDGQWIEVAR